MLPGTGELVWFAGYSCGGKWHRVELMQGINPPAKHQLELNFLNKSDIPQAAVLLQEDLPTNNHYIVKKQKQIYILH